jgi:hypothetical protein
VACVALIFIPATPCLTLAVIWLEPKIKYLQFISLSWQAFLASLFDRQLGGLDWPGTGAFSTLMFRLRADVFLGSAFELQPRLDVRNDSSPLAFGLESIAYLVCLTSATQLPQWGNLVTSPPPLTHRTTRYVHLPAFLLFLANHCGHQWADYTSFGFRTAAKHQQLSKPACSLTCLLLRAPAAATDGQVPCVMLPQEIPITHGPYGSYTLTGGDLEQRVFINEDNSVERPGAYLLRRWRRHESPRRGQNPTSRYTPYHVVDGSTSWGAPWTKAHMHLRRKHGHPFAFFTGQ